MSEPLRIFVSATADLESQRAVIGRTLAEMPMLVHTEIRRYPPAGVSYETLFELISNVDRVYFLLGRDITAPSGAEWELAMRLERPLLALRTRAHLTPAALGFLAAHATEAPPSEWKAFRSDLELARIIGLDTADLLLKPANRYGLTLSDVERLLIWRQRWQPPTPNPEPGGAESGAIILGKQP